MAFLRDLFMGIGNQFWDLGRVAAGWAIFSTSALAIHKHFFIAPITLAEYSSSMMYVLTGCVIFIGGKDLALVVANRMNIVPPAGDK